MACETNEEIHVGEYLLNKSPENILGEGSFGWVYRGSHPESGRTVAIKEILTETLHTDELDSVRRLQCPFIVKYLAVVVDEGSAFLIMKMYDSDLNAFLTVNGRLTHANISILAKSLAQGYFAISETNIVHRDIKPQNILLVIQRRSETTPNANQKQDRIVKAVISDFGCSKKKTDSPHASLHDDNDPHASLVGTPLYMAPEMGSNVVTDSEYGDEVDMWSIGVVLYQAMTGTLPFDESALCRLFLKALTHSYVGYHAPRPDKGDLTTDNNSGGPLMPSTAGTWLLKLNDIVERLLSLNPHTRLKPRPFHNSIVYDHPLPSDDELLSVPGGDGGLRVPSASSSQRCSRTPSYRRNDQKSVKRRRRTLFCCLSSAAAD